MKFPTQVLMCHSTPEYESKIRLSACVACNQIKVEMAAGQVSHLFDESGEYYNDESVQKSGKKNAQIHVRCQHQRKRSFQMFTGVYQCIIAFMHHVMMMNAAIVLSQKLQTKSGMMFLDLIQNWSQHSAAAIKKCLSALVSHIKTKT